MTVPRLYRTVKQKMQIVHRYVTHFVIRPNGAVEAERHRRWHYAQDWEPLTETTPTNVPKRQASVIQAHDQTDRWHSNMRAGQALGRISFFPSHGDEEEFPPALSTHKQGAPLYS